MVLEPDLWENQLDSFVNLTKMNLVTSKKNSTQINFPNLVTIKHNSLEPLWKTDDRTFCCFCFSLKTPELLSLGFWKQRLWKPHIMLCVFSKKTQHICLVHLCLVVNIVLVQSLWTENRCPGVLAPKKSHSQDYFSFKKTEYFILP